MYYRIYFILLLLFLSHSATGQDSDPRRYRVELIVLMHLDHAEEPRETKWLDDYAEALDFLAPEEEPSGDEESGSTKENTSAGPETATDVLPDAAGVTVTEGVPGDDEDPDAEADPLADVLHLPELGEEMQEAWRRLRLSGPFRPLQSLSWEQSGSAPFPILRVHDEELVLVQDPWAEERAALETQETPPEQPASPQDGATNGAVEDEEGEGIPPPLRYYRLDGTAQLTRSRFLHLALAIEWREPVFGAAPVVPPVFAEDDQEAPAPVPEAFRVHRLEQKRQVRTGRMEYFDGPVLGVLVRITRVRVDQAPDSVGESDPEDWEE